PEQVFMVCAVMDGLQDGRHGEFVIPGHFLGGARLQTNGVPVERLRPQAAPPFHEVLPIVRAASRSQVLVLAFLAHDAPPPALSRQTILNRIIARTNFMNRACSRVVHTAVYRGRRPECAPTPSRAPGGAAPHCAYNSGLPRGPLRRGRRSPSP